jgi:hypothetical protein
MCTTINALWWTYSLTLWQQRNVALHGPNSALTLERCREEAVTKATTENQNTLGNIPPSDSIIPHCACITDILNWTKQHLDAYLATAEVVCKQNVETG